VRVATAAKLADPHGTCILLYSSGPYLSATAERLGIPWRSLGHQVLCAAACATWCPSVVRDV